MKLKTTHSGADWLRSNGVEQISPLGEDVADLLGHLFKGIYHVSYEVMKVDWSNAHHIAFKFSSELATWDFNQLTELVLLAHDLAIRVSIQPRMRNMLLLFHRRTREGTFSHPTIEEHITILRAMYRVEP